MNAATDGSDADELDDEDALPEREGQLSKWTNYLHGWQNRWVTLRNGKLEYFKSKAEREFSRAKIDISHTVVKRHQIDPNRFELRCGDQALYLRAASIPERDDWLAAIEATQEALDPSSLKRSGSVGSIASLVSLGSNGPRGYKDRLQEVRTLHGLSAGHLERILTLWPKKRSAKVPEELKRELLSFKAHATSALASLEECIEKVNR